MLFAIILLGAFMLVAALLRGWLRAKAERASRKRDVSSFD